MKYQNQLEIFTLLCTQKAIVLTPQVVVRINKIVHAISFNTTIDTQYVPVSQVIPVHSRLHEHWLPFTHVPPLWHTFSQIVCPI